jgi:hypothetical protein
MKVPISAETVRDNLEPLSTAATAGVGVKVWMMGDHARA